MPVQVTRIKVEGQISWEVAKSRAGRFIAVCKPLALTMEGDTLDELYARINDGIQLLMIDLMESGELDSFLRKRGWKHSPVRMRKFGKVEFDVPIELLFRSGRDKARTLLQ